MASSGEEYQKKDTPHLDVCDTTGLRRMQTDKMKMKYKAVETQQQPEWRTLANRSGDDEGIRPEMEAMKDGEALETWAINGKFAALLVSVNRKSWKTNGHKRSNETTTVIYTQM